MSKYSRPTSSLAQITPQTEEKFAYTGSDDNIVVIRVQDVEKLRPMEKALRLKHANIRDTLPPGFYLASDGEGLSNVKLRKVEVSTDDLLLTKDSVVPGIIKEIQTFLTRGDIFRKFGFNHKRGYLFYGAAGGGKTSALSLMAREFFSRGGIVLMGENAWMIKSALQDIRKVNKETPLMVLLEDIDAMIDKGDEAELLSILDGQYSSGNTVNVATTNYPEKLDNRMTNRPSRFDRRIEFGLPSEEVRREYILTKLAVDQTESEIDVWVKLTEGMGFAHLKEVVSSVKCLGNDLHETIKLIKDLKKLPKSKSQDNAVGFGKDI